MPNANAARAMIVVCFVFMLLLLVVNLGGLGLIYLLNVEGRKFTWSVGFTTETMGRLELHLAGRISMRRGSRFVSLGSL